jgi:polymorphic toxin system DSP-PTPase phosphatase-like protein
VAALGRFARPELVGESPPRVAQIGPSGHALQLPVCPHEGAEIGLYVLALALLEHADIPRARVDPGLGGKVECAVAQLSGRGLRGRHASAIGTRSTAIEAVPSDEVPEGGRLHVVRPPTVIEPGRLIAGRHPCAAGAENAPSELEDLVSAGVTLFLDLTQKGELDPYAPLVSPPARYLNIPMRDFSVPTADELVSTLDEIDSELRAGGLVYVHCWAGCGRTGVVVGSWLVRHGVQPKEALRRIGEARGLGCPQTLEQRFLVLDWQRGA